MVDVVAGGGDGVFGDDRTKSERVISRQFYFWHVNIKKFINFLPPVVVLRHLIF